MTASGSAPIYFDPAVYVDKYDFSEKLIDGGIICNNPVMYATMHAKFYLKKKKFRVLSLGTGEYTDPNKKSDTDHDSSTKIDTIKAFTNFDYVMNFESAASDAIMKQFA